MNDEHNDPDADDAPVDPDEEATVRAFLHAEPRPAVDELTRQRIVRAALAATPQATKRRLRARVVLAAGAAAVVAVAAATVLSQRGDDEPRLANLNRDSVASTWTGNLGPADADAILEALAHPTTAPFDDAAMPDTVVQCAAERADGRTLVTSFEATLEPAGVPAFAFRFEQQRTDAGLVVASSDCRLLDRFDVPDTDQAP